MSVDILIGLQWGDEGKGKMVDVLAPTYNFIIRSAGGHNAGHTISREGKKFSLHILPSGILYPECINIIGSGVVLNPAVFLEEINAFPAARVLISTKAHLILPHHERLDAALELTSSSPIGTTKKGIGPAYADKMKRIGLRVGDLMNLPALFNKLDILLNSINYYKSIYKINIPTLNELKDELTIYANKLKPYIFDVEPLIFKSIKEHKHILLEGAQGSLLDIDHGTYPFVTSSNTVAAGACVGSGVSPRYISSVIGVMKAYCTRVGNGPFPSEELGEMGDKLQSRGDEFGATTGRKRRCGWLDLVSLKYSIDLNGVDAIALTKLDVLDGFNEIKIVNKYKNYDYFPQLLDDISVEYQIFKGWEYTRGYKNYHDLPREAKMYIEYIEDFLQVPIKYISTSPEREDIIIK